MFQKEVVYHRGEQKSYKKKMKSLYIRTKNALIEIKNLDYWYLLKQI